MSKDFLHLLTDSKVGPNLKSKILLFKFQFFKGQTLTLEQELEINYWIEFFHNNYLDKLESIEKFILNGFGCFSKYPEILAFASLSNNEEMISSKIILNWMKKCRSESFYSTLQKPASWNERLIFKPSQLQKIVPVKGQKNVLVTSALPYVNNVPHLGNIIGATLSADVFARYCRLRGYNTLYVCGTDEYGTTTEIKALEEKVSCQELCDKYHKLHKEAYDWFDIGFDAFGRTTTNEQTRICQDIFLKLEKNGHILEQTVTQLYCEKHGSFLADRMVEGTCPLCGYNDARGDQCDGCGKLLNATDLISPRCKLDNATPIPKDSNHLFLNLTEQQPILEDWVNSASEKGSWSANSTRITQSWLKEGLKPRCITRDLKWGTPVPKKGYEDKVFYVWFDAPIGYLSITANYTPDWELWWKNPQDVQLFQFMGKDNVPFHTVIFPSTLLGTNENWTLLHHISTTEYLLYENGKFSKSRGVGVFGNNVMDSGIPPSVWRYYLLSSRPETSDSQFSWKGLITANNSELLANLGNYVNRLLKFINAKYGKVIPSPAFEPADKKLISDVNVLLREYVEALEACKIRGGLKLVMDISSLGNSYLQDQKLDNNLFTNNKTRCDTVVYLASNLIYLLGALLAPYLPSTSSSLYKQLNAPPRIITDVWDGSDIPAGHQIGKPEYLFQRIDETREDELRSKYGGNQKPKMSAEALKALEDEIKAQGDLVRKLKLEKSPLVPAQVLILKNLKTKLKDA